MKVYYLEASVSHTSRIVLSHSSRLCAHIPEPLAPPKMSLQSPRYALPEVSHASRNLWVRRFGPVLGPPLPWITILRHVERVDAM